jgi:hypothetical protein
MARRLFTIATAAGFVLVAAACTQGDDETAAQAPPPAAAPEPAPEPAALGAVALGTASGPDTAITETKQEFAPGEPIHLSMELLGAAAGTTVTTYWYGPEGRRLAYETKTVAPSQRRLHFTQDNTADWAAGQYRTEVWIGDNKVREQSFEIAAG